MPSKKILVTPLDWGLGHATRCIPLIRLLIQKGCTVMIASSGTALTLLKEEFPALTFFLLPSYQVRYSLKIPMMMKIFFQIPKFLRAILKEHYQLQKIINSTNLDIVISDNRYGCWSRKVKSIFITHQINIPIPHSMKIFVPIVNYFSYLQIRRFNQCWVPDENDNGLTKEMIIPRPFDVRHIGILSRFKKKETDFLTMPWDITVILSGPEPQRTYFEERIICQLKKMSIRTFIVRGVFHKKVITKQTDNLQIVNHIDSHTLQGIIERSKLIVCRSGYSSIMDLMFLGKKVFFVPTPGHGEQEYLAHRLKEEGIAYFQHQSQFDLNKALKETNKYTGFSIWKQPLNLLSEALDNLLK